MVSRVGVLLLLAFCVPVWAQEAATPTPSGDIAENPIDLGEVQLQRLYKEIESLPARETAEITLIDCAKVALDANQDILIAEYTPLKATADVFSAWGEFDPILNGQAQYLRSSQSTSSDIRTYSGGISSIDVYRTTTMASVSGKLPWGTSYSLRLDMQKDENTYNRFREEFNGDASITLSQPLLRGWGMDYGMTRIRVAKKALNTAEDTLRVQVLTSTSSVLKAYWDLVGARENVRVRREALQHAERLLETNQKRLDIGTGTALDVVQAQAGIASRQNDLITALTQVRNAEDQLKNLLNTDKHADLLPKELVPLDSPQPIEATASDETSLKAAFENRPEVRQAVKAIEIATLQRDRARRDMLPQLDLQGTAMSGGRNHYLEEVFARIREREDTSYSVGLQGSVSLGNHAARGAHQRSQFDVREAEEKLAKVKQQLLLNVRVAVRNLNTSRTLVESTRQARILQDTNLAAEEKRLKLGVTSSFELLRVQEDLTLAQMQEVQALVNAEKALVDLRLAEGTLLERLGLTFEGIDPEPPVGYFSSITPHFKD